MSQHQLDEMKICWQIAASRVNLEAAERRRVEPETISCLELGKDREHPFQVICKAKERS